jgi:hypothetical protein
MADSPTKKAVDLVVARLNQTYSYALPFIPSMVEVLSTSLSDVLDVAVEICETDQRLMSDVLSADATEHTIKIQAMARRDSDSVEEVKLLKSQIMRRLEGYSSNGVHVTSVYSVPEETLSQNALDSMGIVVSSLDVVVVVEAT